MKLYQDRDWLYQKYVIEKLSSVDIGKICDLPPSNICNWLSKYNIKKRSQSEGAKLRIKKHPRSKNWIKYKCKYCGKDFYRKKNGSHVYEYCSNECRFLGSRKRIKKNCENCGKLLELRPCEIKNNKKFCSNKCIREYRIGKNHPRWKPKIEVKCEWCDKKIYIYEYKKNSQNQGRFCSQECMIKWRTKNFSGMNNPNYRDAKKIYIYANCGREYIEFKRNEGKTRFCSRECVGSATIKNHFPFGQQKMTSIEKIIDDHTKEYVKFVGLGNYWLKLNGKNKNPDFKIVGQKKVIEIFGDYWHRNDDPYDLIFEYRKIKYDCLVIWEYEIKNDLDNVLEKINNFIS